MEGKTYKALHIFHNAKYFFQKIVLRQKCDDENKNSTGPNELVMDFVKPWSTYDLSKKDTRFDTT